MIAPGSPHKLSPSEIDALPLRAWLRHRFGLVHRLALATIAVDLGLYATGFDVETAENLIQIFYLLVLLPMSIVAVVYFTDAAVAVVHRLGLTSRARLYPPSDDSVAPAADGASWLTPDAPAVEARESDLADRSRTAAKDARRVLLVVGTPAAFAVLVGIIIITSDGFEGGGTWIVIGILGLLVAVAPTIADWRRTANEPLPNLSNLDARFAQPPASPGPQPTEASSRPDSDRIDDP